MFVDHYYKPVDDSAKREPEHIDRSMPDWLRSASVEDIILLEALNYYKSYISKGVGGGLWGEKTGKICQKKVNVLGGLYKKFNLDDVKLTFDTNPLQDIKDNYDKIGDKK